MKNQKEWKNHKGEVVPDKYVSGYDKKKEKSLAKIVKEASALNKRLNELKTLMFAEADALNELMYKAYHMEKPEDSKGNLTVYNFDKSIRFSIKVQDVIEFDDRIKMAQEKLNQFVEEKSAGADGDLVMLVNNAFKTTKGRLDKSRIFSLFSLNITKPTWVEAINLIKESITTNHTRKYASIAVRNDAGEYKDINLNISSL